MGAWCAQIRRRILDMRYTAFVLRNRFTIVKETRGGLTSEEFKRGARFGASDESSDVLTSMFLMQGKQYLSNLEWNRVIKEPGENDRETNKNYGRERYINLDREDFYLDEKRPYPRCY
jgi:hypothetical protein